jgi:hypothetical protein
MSHQLHHCSQRAIRQSGPLDGRTTAYWGGEQCGLQSLMALYPNKSCHNDVSLKAANLNKTLVTTQLVIVFRTVTKLEKTIECGNGDKSRRPIVCTIPRYSPVTESAPSSGPLKCR